VVAEPRGRGAAKSLGMLALEYGGSGASEVPARGRAIKSGTNRVPDPAENKQPSVDSKSLFPQLKSFSLKAALKQLGGQRSSWSSPGGHKPGGSPAERKPSAPPGHGSAGEGLTPLSGGL